MKAVDPLELLDELFTRRRQIRNALRLKEVALKNFNEREARIWGDAGHIRASFLGNLVTTERHRLSEIEEDIIEAAGWLVNERANRETKAA